MEQCLAVQREIDRVVSKFEDINSDSAEVLNDLINCLQNVKHEIADGEGELSPAHSLVLTQCTKKIREACKKLGQEHKDLHSSVSKVGKAIDRNFVSDFSGVISDPCFELQDRRELINSVIVQHFLRQGMLDLAERLMQDADFTIDESQKEPFIELHRILDALRNQNLSPALSWAERNRELLRGLNSSIEFKLHRLQFISLIGRGLDGQMEALLYARNFGPFAKTYEKEVQILMGSLLYLRQGVRNSPYSHLLDPIHWLEICDVFTRDACSLLGLSVESHLSVCIRAGCLALPPLLNIKQVMQQRQCSGVWGAKDELPKYQQQLVDCLDARFMELRVEIDVGKECRYHSIFACPILRQQSSTNNPPVRLICGHVISKDALNKLSNGNKMKCPYCPMEQSPSSAQTICF